MNPNMINRSRLERRPNRQGTFDRTGDHTGHEAKPTAGERLSSFVFSGSETMTKLQNDIRIKAPLALEAKANAQGRIEGYASTIGGEPDRQGDVVLAGAFTASLQDHGKAGTLPAMLWSHRLEEPIGHWLKMAEDQTGLYVEGQLNLETAKGRDAFEHIKAGDAGAFSIGYLVPEGGREYAGKGVFHLKQVELLEISVVSVPANPRARISGVKSLGSKAEAVDMLRGCGLPKAAAQRFAAGGYPALTGTHSQEHFQKLAAQIDAAIERITR